MPLMAQPSELDLVLQLQTSTSPADKIKRLREIKNEIIGHTRKKELFVAAGVLDVLVAVCKSSWDSQPSLSPARSLTGHEQTRLLALQLIASFAQGGTAFLKPLHESSAIEAVLDQLRPEKNLPQLVPTALGTLLKIADAATTAGPTDEIDEAWLATYILSSKTTPVLEILAGLLLPQQLTRATERHVSDVSLLIIRLCCQECHRVALAESPVLDNLAVNLASVAVELGYVVPGADIWGRSNSLDQFLPSPALSDSNLAVLLHAISSVIGDSRYAAYRFLHCPSIMAAFPNLEFDPGAEMRSNYRSLQLAGLGDAQSQRLGAMDYLLPTVPIPRPKGVHTTVSTYPPLGTRPNPCWDAANGKSTSAATKAPSIWFASRFDSGSPGDLDAEDTESPVVPWLIHLVRFRRGVDKLAAASLLSSLCKAKFVGRQREASIGCLVVPPLLSLLSQVSKDAQQNGSSAGLDTTEKWGMMASIPLVISRLVAESDVLQKAACDADAVKIVSKLLKDSYEPLPDVSQLQEWSPAPEATDLDGTAVNLPSSRRLGLRGVFPLLIHRTKVRESALKAVAALAALKEDYRKAFIEQDVLAYVTESLYHIPEKPAAQKDRTRQPGPSLELKDTPENPCYGVNPVPVIVAACHAIRVLSRAVSIVRTSLFDCGVSLPLFKLMRHKQGEIQVAATGAIVNLVTDVAPMRSKLTEWGIMDVLCLYAHAENSALRLNALWALKHFVHCIPNTLKKTCFDHLGSGWLVKLICEDSEDEAVLPGTDSYADDDLDDVMEDQPTESWRSGSGSFQSASTERSRIFRHIESRLSALREAERSTSRKARADDLAIQEQGLDFIRNLIGGGNNPAASADEVQDTTTMIDHLFQEIGSDRLFSILLSKLTNKVLHGFSRRRSVGVDGSETATRLVTPHPKIVHSAIMVLVHIAGSIPRYRQMIIAQQDLLKQLHSQFIVKDRDVRVSLCYLVSNLAWRDDMTDAQGARQRVVELRRLGFHSRLEALEAEDPELDVRERAKGALAQMKESMGF